MGTVGSVVKSGVTHKMSRFPVTDGKIGLLFVVNLIRQVAAYDRKKHKDDPLY